MLNVMVTKT